MSTTTVSLETSITTTTSLTATKTVIVLGILNLLVTQGASSTPETHTGIVLANKDVPSSTDSSTSTTTSTITSTISTFTSSSTTTSLATPSSTASSTTPKSNTLFGSSNPTNGGNSNIGLVVGIPIAVVGSIILGIALYYYLRLKRRNKIKAEQNLKTYYDEKYNYRISPGEASSPFNMRTVYEAKPRTNYYNYPENSTEFDSSKNSNINSRSQISLKEPNVDSGTISKWNLNTPLSKWFAKHSAFSEASSRASLSTGGPFSPVIALKEFKLNKNRINKSNVLAESSPILPKFPETSYYPSNQQYYHSTKKLNNSGNTAFEPRRSNTKEQMIKTVQKRHHIPIIEPVALNRKKNLNKVPPDTPTALISLRSFNSLQGLEQRVLQRIVATTPSVDISQYKSDPIFKIDISYTKNLADELTVNKGELVKVLARHTDGWCLGEKVDDNGDPLYVGISSYINEGRGVFPEACLTKIYL